MEVGVIDRYGATPACVTVHVRVIPPPVMVIVPVLEEVPVFSSTVTYTEPLPEPDPG